MDFKTVPAPGRKEFTKIGNWYMEDFLNETEKDNMKIERAAAVDLLRKDCQVFNYAIYFRLQKGCY